MNKEWKETFMAVIDTNMDMIESLDSYEENRNDESTIEAVKGLEKINSTLREHLENELPLSNAEINMIGVYTSTARGAYAQKAVLCNKMVSLCYDIEDKIASCVEAENPSEEFYKKFSGKMNLSID